MGGGVGAGVGGAVGGGVGAAVGMGVVQVVHVELGLFTSSQHSSHASSQQSPYLAAERVREID